VAFIEQVQTVSLIAEQTGATWGLDRVDQPDRPLDTKYKYNHTGTGVQAFIIDTGIRADHIEFGTRVDTFNGFSAFDDNPNDCHGHGTHVAGTVGGTIYGVAKEVTLIPVRVLDCGGSGSTAGVIAGVDHVARYKTNNSSHAVVANMSLGGSASSAMDNAVKGAVDKGVVVVVAAGNSNLNACNYSPAREPSAITVGATTSSDARASYSNFGTCLDLFAPGSTIRSAYIRTTTDVVEMSGTSMASPHVAGVAALVLQSTPSAKPAAVRNFIVDNATPGKVTSAGTGSPNLLLYSLATGTPTDQEIKIRTISTTSAKSGKNWLARATVTVNRVKADGSWAEGVPGVTVQGSYFANNTYANTSCITGSNGSCVLSSPTYSSKTASTIFSITGVSHTGSKSLGCENCTSLTINKPK